MRCWTTVLLAACGWMGRDLPSARAADEAAPSAAIVADWRLQDGVGPGRSYRQAVTAIFDADGLSDALARKKFPSLPSAADNDAAWRDVYVAVCRDRRQRRLRRLVSAAPRIVFTKHYDLGGSHYAYTEGQSDAQAERHFVPGSSLCSLTVDVDGARVRTLLSDAGGVIRDPDVSYDGRRVLFAWKKSLQDDDYHLYEMDLATRAVRQLTSGLGFADYEGVYLPNGDLVFNSTRCVQTVDCWWTEVSNLYTCDGDGRYLRRLTFDQVHTNYPTVTSDGRILYTRWDYNDRGQIFPQGLFQMNADGTGQSEFYGNNSWFPTTILHARGVPDTQRALAIFTGHHTLQQGWLGTINVARGRQENRGARLIAPERDTPAERIDRYGQTGDQFQYPYPLNESEFLVGRKPAGSRQPFAIYWMDRDGRRELLAADPEISCNQPVPLRPRPLSPARPARADYRQRESAFYLQNIHAGDGLAGVPPGTVKRLRVVALDFRAAGIGENRSHGEAGGALSSTPVSIGNGAWDAKIVLGEATVHEDGSAFFAVPPRTPIYLQALDADGRMVQTMRSWSSLQPGEVASCVGCHENKNSTPLSGALSRAMRAGVERLAGGADPPRGFSFPQEIQPILDQHCVRCHYLPAQLDGEDLTRAATAAPSTTASAASHANAVVPAFSLRGVELTDPGAKRRWSESYLVLTQSRRENLAKGKWSYSGRPNAWVPWISVQSAPPMLSPYSGGSSQSRLLTVLREGHRGATLSREELRKIACWIDLAVPYCGDYREANAWTAAETRTYRHFLDKRLRMETIERENIDQFISENSQ